jgi:hypothetical protein
MLDSGFNGYGEVRFFCPGPLSCSVQEFYSDTGCLTSLERIRLVRTLMIL